MRRSVDQQRPLNPLVHVCVVHVSHVIGAASRFVGKYLRRWALELQPRVAGNPGMDRIVGEDDTRLGRFVKISSPFVFHVRGPKEDDGEPWRCCTVAREIFSWGRQRWPHRCGGDEADNPAPRVKWERGGGEWAAAVLCWMHGPWAVRALSQKEGVGGARVGLGQFVGEGERTQ